MSISRKISLLIHEEKYLRLKIYTTMSNQYTESKFRKIQGFLQMKVVGVNSENSHVRNRPPPPHLAGGLLETPHQPQRITKGQVLTFISPNGCQEQVSR
jgi:hypothetical protein